MDKTIILIVEDDIAYSDLVQIQLNSIGCSSANIIAIQSIEEAKEVKDELDPDVILLDLNILDSGGLSTYEKINDIFPESSVIVLSGMDDQNLALEIVAKGGQDYILKSDVKPQILEKTINYGMLRKSMIKKIAVSEKRYRELFERSPLPMFQLTGQDLNISMANPAALELYGYQEDFLLNNNIQILNPKHDIEVLENTPIRLNHFTKKTKELTVDLIFNKLNEKEDEYIVLVIDRTEELAFERNKFTIISQAEEGEKKKIARELHDGLGQQMVLLNLLYQNFEPSDNQNDSYKDIGNLLQSCIREVKEIAYNLLPPELEKGFLNAIDRFANRINNIGSVEFKIEIDENVTESDFTNVDTFNLYRLIQEVVNNALKHAKTKELVFNISKNEKEISIRISDFGVGFDLEKVQEGLGIQNVYYRMKMANIKGEINSEIGKGTNVVLNFSTA